MPLSRPTVTPITTIVSAPDDLVFSAKQAADQYNQFEFDGDGTMRWGQTGAVPPDTILGRVVGAGGGALYLSHSNPLSAILRVAADQFGEMVFISGTNALGTAFTDVVTDAAEVRLRGSTVENVRITTIGGLPAVGLFGAQPIVKRDITYSASGGSLPLATAQFLADMCGVNVINTDDTPPEEDP